MGGVLAGLAIIVAVYWFWWRKRQTKSRNGAASGPRRTKPNNPLKEFRIGNGNREVGEKDGNDDGLTGPAGPGEEDAMPVKRQSLRFDQANNTNQNLSRRSLSGSHIVAPATADNPFGDHNSLPGTTGHSSEHRESTAPTISEFSFRSSQSSNIIPIAYIPAHSASNSIADMHEQRAACGHYSSNGRPSSAMPSSSANMLQGTKGGRLASRHSVAGSTSEIRSSQGGIARSSRLSVPFSLHSSNADDSLVVGSSMFGRSGPGATFSTLFDRRTSRTAAPGNRHSEQSRGLEVIASPDQPGYGKGAHSPTSTTPTHTKSGRPIRPPRAPGLDLKLPEPEPVSPPAPVSPGYPWPVPDTSALSPTASSPTDTLHPPMNGRGSKRGQYNRETLRSDGARASAYSTFSQASGSTASHMSYILDPPQVNPFPYPSMWLVTDVCLVIQIITPVSAGVQVVHRAAAKSVRLPPSGSASSLSSPNPASYGMLPPSPATFATTGHSGAASYASSPLAREASFRKDVAQRANATSPMSDNPFDDEQAVRIAMPSSADNTPVMADTPTFANQISDHASRAASRASERRASDLSVFTSSSAAHGYHDAVDSAREHDGASRRSSYAGGAQSVASDEVILTPPIRPFAENQYAASEGPNSRHTSAAMSTRSGYASVLDGIPFNLSLSPEARHSQASSAGMGGAARASMASSAADTDGGDRRDTTYSLSSEWNGAFAGMPIALGGLVEEPAVPGLPSIYLSGAAAAAAGLGEQQRSSRDDRYSTDSLAVAAAVARSFDDRN